MRNPAPLSAWLVLALTGASFHFPLKAAAFTMGPYFARIIGPKTVDPGVGTDFTCSADCSPSCTYTWSMEGKTVQGQVATVTPSGKTKSLELECTALNPETGKSSKATKTVGVNGGLVLVRIIGPETAKAKEETDFTCSADCSPPCTYIWSLEGQTAQGPVVTLTPSGATKSLVLECTALNPDTGKSLKATKMIQVISPSTDVIQMGPYFARIIGPKMAAAGEGTDFTCSADCSPSCTYTWSMDGKTVQGEEVTVTPSGATTSLQLECTALNPATGKSAKTTETVQVKNPVALKPQSVTEPSLGEPFSLTCAGADPTATIEWLKDGYDMTIDAQMSLSADKSTVRFTSLLPSHGGFYRCAPSKGGSRIVSTGYLLSYGKLSVSVSGPDTVVVGKEHVYECNANCEIECSIYWTFRGGLPSGSYSQRQTVIRWTPDQPDTTQVFTCVVENTAARRSATYSKTVKVVEEADLLP
ncbi:hypothetical protein AGOR_G00212120 [Albula goreensis]|uniref:Ig-like domain-containing protein n=1 Tax=Albula goreensis TaxID=1534307 RepID=A0A8T3CPC0_9TELE|nr:hypothetical protein AGOR_G00212120 [Albula goreensis]